MLLQGGRTTYSRFRIHIVVNKFTTCSFKAELNVVEFIKKTKLIIWDETSMISKHCPETLERSMCDLLKCDRPFGGKVIVFSGNFRQILPVITEGGRVYTILAPLNSSHLWSSCKVLELTKNMRLLRGVR